MTEWGRGLLRRTPSDVARTVTAFAAVVSAGNVSVTVVSVVLEAVVDAAVLVADVVIDVSVVVDVSEAAAVCSDDLAVPGDTTALTKEEQTSNPQIATTPDVNTFPVSVVRLSYFHSR